MLKMVRHDFSSNLFCLAEPKNFAGNPSVLCVRKFLVPNKFMDKKWGVSRVSIGNFLSHIAEKLRK